MNKLAVILVSTLLACGPSALGPEPGADAQPDSDADRRPGIDAGTEPDRPDAGASNQLDAAKPAFPANITYAVSASGSGQSHECPPSSAFSHTFSGTDAITFIFDELAIEAGPGAELSSYRYCTLTLAFEHTPGWRFRFKSVDTRGFAELDSPDSAGFELWPKMNGSAGGPDFARELAAPYADDFTHRFEDSPNHSEWSGCGGSGALALDYDTWIDWPGAEAGAAIIYTDSIDLVIEWQECD